MDYKQMSILAAAARHRKYYDNFEQLFWSKVDKTPGFGPWGDCWEWKGTINKVHGYGTIMHDYHQKRAHVLSYMFTAKEVIPKGLVVRHKCDNKICVNPDHLLLGTPKQNSEDSVERGLTNKGEDRYNAKLTEEKVKEIRKLYRSGYHGKTELGKMFGVSDGTIHKIINYQRWKHVE